jgi:hypothetical protein
LWISMKSNVPFLIHIFFKKPLTWFDVSFILIRLFWELQMLNVWVSSIKTLSMHRCPVQHWTMSNNV